MPKVVPPLTDLQIRNARATGASYKLFDGGGLYLEVTPAGGKLWKLKYRTPQGRENKLSLGAYPTVTLQAARERRLQVRRQLSEGRDPAEERNAAMRAKRQAADDSFEAVARAWHANMREQWQPSTADNILHRLQVDIFPEIGRMRISDVQPRDVLAAVRKIEQRGALEVAKRITADVSRVFVFAFHSSLVENNPAASLNKVLKPRVKGHFASIDSEHLSDFVRALAYNEACMGPVVRIAMRLMMLVFVRTSELIETPWDELRFGEPWIIPWQRMKRGKRKVNPDQTNHHVCLPRQGWALLGELRTYTGNEIWLFPNMWNPARPMSNNAILKALGAWVIRAR